VQQITPQLTVGLDGYYKIARDLLDDGQFGAALVLDGFNYEKAYNKGLELSATYKDGNFTAYGNLAWAVQKATNIVSNQYLIDPDDLAYIANNYIYTDHAQTWTGSAGASYLWDGTRFSASLMYGSGLRADLVLPDGSTIPNGAHVPAYATVNLGVSHEFAIRGDKPITVRFDVVNLFDTTYQIRDGSGVGVFAPQYSERRGFFVGLSKKL
jgi:outer membrane receptor protein involved in Fe transport